jgi:hypothetical protein
MDTKNKADENAKNRDPLSGEPGAHPAGAGAGAAVGGAVAGVALGTAAGPVGTVAGAIAGGIAGAFAGKAIAEQINPTEEDAYWQENYRSRPYVTNSTDYNVYRPAYRYGWESRVAREGQRFEDVEHELRAGWGSTSNLKWDDVRPAVRDAWDRIDQRSAAVGPGNSRISEEKNT